MKKGTSVWHGLLNVLRELIVNKCKCITLFKNVNNNADSIVLSIVLWSRSWVIWTAFNRDPYTCNRMDGRTDVRVRGRSSNFRKTVFNFSYCPSHLSPFLPQLVYPSLSYHPFPATKPPSQIEIYSLGEHCKLHQCVWHRARPQKQFWHFWSPGMPPGGKNLGSSCVVNLFQNIPLSTLYRLGFGKPGHVSTSESACEDFTAVWAHAQRNTSNNTARKHNYTANGDQTGYREHCNKLCIKMQLFNTDQQTRKTRDARFLAKQKTTNFNK